MISLFSLLATLFTFPAFTQVPGDPDLDFATDGFDIRTVGAGNAFGRDILEQPDGKILIAGTSSNGVDNDFTVMKYTSSGELDSTFGEGGVVQIDISGATDITEAIALDASNRILVAGSADTGDGFAFAVTRLNSDGTIDSTFGNQGKVLIKAWTTGFCKSVIVQKDHKIVLGGYVFNPLLGNNVFTLTRCTEAGLLDDEFGQQGIVMTDLGIGAGVANDMAIQQDGKIILAGQVLNDATFLWELALVRYDTHGVPDLSWGDEGLVRMSFPQKNFTIKAVTLDREKNILAAGYLGTAPSNNLFAVARFQKDGTPDATFGTEGLVINSFGAADNQINDLEVQSDGFILVAGTSLSGNADRFAIARLDHEGNPDPSFGQNGIVITVHGLNDGIEATALQHDGKLLVVGESFDGNRFQMVIGRYETGVMTGTNNPIDPVTSIQVYPNPTSDFVHVSFTLEEALPVEIQLFNRTGKMVHSFSSAARMAAGEYQETYAVPVNLPAGIYHLVVNTGHQAAGINLLIRP